MTCLDLGDLLFEEATVDTERQKKVEDRSHSLQEVYVVKECSPQVHTYNNMYYMCDMMRLC